MSDSAPTDAELAAEPVAVPVQVELAGQLNASVLRLTSTDRVIDIRAWISQQPEYAHITCFGLALGDALLDDQAEMGAVPGFAPQCVVRLVPRPYDARQVALHVAAIQHLLLPRAVARPDGFLPHLLTAHPAHPATPASGQQAPSPAPAPAPAPVLPAGSVTLPPPSPSLEALFGQPAPAHTAPRLLELTFSAWNAPPASRLLQGDLNYLRVTTLDHETCHVTAHVSGFFVNRSTDTVFDPRPHAARAGAAPTLVDTLRHWSVSFRGIWAAHEAAVSAAAQAAAEGAEAALLSSSGLLGPSATTSRPVWMARPWCQAPEAHVADEARADRERMPWAEHNPASPGLLRDWNDELQYCRELPVTNAVESFNRQRAIYQFQCDFSAAAAQGAKAIVHGCVPPLNPAEPPAAHMYIWQNIFFSHALDSREIYTGLGGDAAAHKAAGHELHGVLAYSSTDSGVSTLATTVVDYLGRRLLAQSVAPGILGQQDNHIVYGINDGRHTMHLDPKLDQLLAAAAPSLHMRSRKVRYVEGQDGPVEHTISASIETKGIRSTDHRLYIMDLTRTTPVDVNFVSVGDDGAVSASPWVSRHALHHHRPELVAAYFQTQLVARARARQASLAAAAAATTAVAAAAPPAEAEAGAVAVAAAETTPATPKSDTDAPAPAPAPATEPLLLPADFAALVVNPDTLAPARPGVEAVADDAPEAEADRATVRAMAALLVDEIVPGIVAQLGQPRAVPLDGAGLVLLLKGQGAGVRYLGAVAAGLAARLPTISDAGAAYATVQSYRLVVQEMIARAAKHLLRQALAAAAPGAWAATIASVLNHLLAPTLAAGAATPSPLSVVDATLPSSSSGGKKGKKKAAPAAAPATTAGAQPAAAVVPILADFGPRKASSLPPVPAAASVTVDELWAQVRAVVASHFRFALPATAASLSAALTLAPPAEGATASAAAAAASPVEDWRRVAVLRAVCTMTGVTVVARALPPANAPLGLTAADVLAVEPVVKDMTGGLACREGRRLLQAGRAHINQGLIREALALLEQAVDVLMQVHGPVHEAVAEGHRVLAALLFQLDQFDVAAEYQIKSTRILELVLGADHVDTMRAYLSLGVYSYHAQSFPRALAVLQHARALCQLVAGSQSPEFSNISLHLASVLVECNEPAAARAYLAEVEAIQAQCLQDELALRNKTQQMIVRVCRETGNFRGSVDAARALLDLTKAQLGDGHERVAEAQRVLAICTAEAVAVAKQQRSLEHASSAKPQIGGKTKKSAPAASAPTAGASKK